jgi:hypothetical protein
VRRERRELVVGGDTVELPLRLQGPDLSSPTVLSYGRQDRGQADEAGIQADDPRHDP